MGRYAVAVAAVLAVAALVAGGAPTVPPGPNVTTGYDGRWLAAKATWYGNPAGAGPDDNGGACGIKDVDRPPYSGMRPAATAPSSTTARAAAHATRYYVR